MAENLYQINNPEQIRQVMRFLNFATQLLKIGSVVVNPNAIPRLFAYDQQAAMMFGSKTVQKSLLNPLNLGEALITTLTSGPFASKIYNVLPSGIQGGINKWREWQRAGGASTEFDIGTKKKSEEWLRSGGKNKISFGSVVDFFGKLDLITKFQIFNAAKQEYLNQGFTEEEATRRASYDSRNTLPNFYRRSQTLRMLDIFKPFLGSAVQSAAKLRTELRNNPQQTVDNFTFIYALPYALATLWNISDEERKKAYEALQDWQKKNKLTLIFDEKDSNGNDYYTQLPMDQNAFGLLTGVRKVIEGAASTGSKDLLSGLSSLFESLYGIKIPLSGLAGNFKDAEQELSSYNPVFVLPFELSANYDYFKGRKIVPDGISSRYAYQQVDDKTSEFAKFLGRRINFNPKENQYGTSPMKIDHALNKFGALGDYVRTAFEKIQGGKGTAEDKKIVNQYEGTLKGLFVDNRYGSAEQKIYEEKAAADMKQAGISFDITEALNRGDFETAKNLANNNVTKQQWAAIENNYQEKQIANTLSPKEKAYFNMPKSYLESIKSSKPEDAAVIDKVLELKKTTTKLPNMDTSGITFKPGTGGGGARLSVKQVKLGKVAKGRKVKLKAPTIKKPTTPKIKLQKVKQPKLVKIKPLKKFKRI